MIIMILCLLIANFFVAQSKCYLKYLMIPIGKNLNTFDFVGFFVGFFL